MIEKKLDLEWVCDTRVDLVNDELLALMSKAGCKVIWFGVESGSETSSANASAETPHPNKSKPHLNSARNTA